MLYYLGIHFKYEIITVLADEAHLVEYQIFCNNTLDCTPAVRHREQVSFIVRFVDVCESKVEICEYYLNFY